MVIESIESSVCAVVLCGGKATRLQSILHGTPKALVRLDRQTYLAGLLQLLRRWGIVEVILCISKVTLLIANEIGDGSKLGVYVKYAVDSGEVESSGALWNALPALYSPLLLCIYGDIVVDVDFRKLLNAHTHSGAAATLVGSTREDQPHPGGVEIGIDGWVREIHEAAQDRGELIIVSPTSIRLANSGVFVFDREAIKKAWPPEQRTGKLEQGLLRTLAAKRMLYAYQNGNRFLRDIGEPGRLAEVKKELARVMPFFPLY